MKATDKKNNIGDTLGDMSDKLYWRMIRVWGVWGVKKTTKTTKTQHKFSVTLC